MAKLPARRESNTANRSLGKKLKAQEYAISGYPTTSHTIRETIHQLAQNSFQSNKTLTFKELIVLGELMGSRNSKGQLWIQYKPLTPETP